MLMIEKVGNQIFNVPGSQKVTPKNSVPTIKDFAKILDELQKFEENTNKVVEEVAAGNLDKLPEAITMASQLNLAIQMIVQVRNRLIAGFQEFMRITM